MSKDKQIYIASGFENRGLLIPLIDKIYEKIPNIVIRATWITAPPTKYQMDVERDFREIDMSDVILAYFPYGTGTLCEVSYAHGLGKYVGVLTDLYYYKGGNLDGVEYSSHFPLVRATKWPFKQKWTPTNILPKFIYAYNFNDQMDWLKLVCEK